MTLPEDSGLPSITSICTTTIFWIKEILCNLANDSSIKHVEAPKTIKAWILIFFEPKYISIIKQGVGFVDSIRFEVVGKCIESSSTIFISYCILVLWI